MPNTTYVLPINETLATAWHKVKGAKGSVWAALGIIFLIGFGLGLIQCVIKAAVLSLLPLTSFIVQFLRIINFFIKAFNVRLNLFNNIINLRC